MAANEPPARVCVLTASSRGALAVVKVWGPRALEVADRVFRPVREAPLSRTGVGLPRLGRVGEGAGDEVVVVVCGAVPPEVEIHCHGGPAAIALVVRALNSEGAESSDPALWVSERAGDAIAAEATLDLARAPTLRTAEVLLEQSRGALRHELAEAIRLVQADRTAALRRIKALIERGTVGLRLTTGWAVALAGRPNVGKSRLLNALAGYDRAIVDPSPGTTRDVVTVRTAFDGWPVEVSDTAGLRPSDDAIEAAGMASARATHSKADLTLLVLDRSSPLTETDLGLIASHPSALLVANKGDLPPAWGPWDISIFPTSAERGDGLDALVSEVARRLVPEAPPPGVGVPFRASHLAALRGAFEALGVGDDRAAVGAIEGMMR